MWSPERTNAAAGPATAFERCPGSGSGRGHRLALRGEARARLGIEEMQLREREQELEDVVRLDPVVRVDDRDDVLAGRGDVEELLVAEVLDDVGLARQGGGVALRLAQL